MSMNKTKQGFFGTDGIRGRANSYPMNADIAMKLGMSAGKLFSRKSHKNRVLIGKDTRLSGYMLEPALTSGFVSVGMDVILVGPMPTPAVAMLTKSLRADLGLMLSASHNLFYDNGIKLFNPFGYKISNEEEHLIEQGILNGVNLVDSSNLGRVKRLDDENGRYVEYLKSNFKNKSTLEGFRIVVDCANGASYRAAPALFSELGAHVEAMHISPNGININENCGSTSPQSMCAKVLTTRSDIGIALDGDADRLILSDEKGKIIDGDQLIAMIAKRWFFNNRLRKKAVVSTVMSNLGLEKYLKSLGLDLLRTNVGDRNVINCMKKEGINLGGEQSGHIILSDFSTTGDGLLAALQILEIMIEEQKPLSELSQNINLVPKVLKSVRIENDVSIENSKIKKIISDSKNELGSEGRLLVRPSGTEPVIRIMVEGNDKKLIDSISELVSNKISEIDMAK